MPWKWTAPLLFCGLPQRLCKTLQRAQQVKASANPSDATKGCSKGVH